MPIEVILPGEGSGWEQGGVRVHRYALVEREVVVRRSQRTTALLRTLFDISRNLSLVEAVVITDMALHKGLAKRLDLIEWVQCQAGRDPGPECACSRRLQTRIPQWDAGNSLDG